MHCNIPIPRNWLHFSCNPIMLKKKWLNEVWNLGIIIPFIYSYVALQRKLCRKFDVLKVQQNICFVLIWGIAYLLFSVIKTVSRKLMMGWEEVGRIFPIYVGLWGGRNSGAAHSEKLKVWEASGPLVVHIEAHE